MNLKIAYLEDDPGDIELLRRYCEEIPSHNIEIVAFSKWDLFLEEVSREEFDIIFLDYFLGEKTGLEVLSELRKRGVDRPITILTGQGDENIAAEITRAGADNYLVKSRLNPDSLRLAIGNMLVSHRLKREESMLARELQEAKVLESIYTLTGGIAHDFNNLLTTITGFVQMAQIENDNQNVGHSLEGVSSGCEKMATLIGRLSTLGDFKGADQGNVDLNSLIQEVKDIVQPTLPAGIELLFDIAPEPIIFSVNYAMIRHALIILLNNGIEAIEGKGQVTLRTRKVEVGSKGSRQIQNLPDGNYIILEVADTGEGLPPDLQKRIFEPFYTTRGRVTAKGTGLNLAIVWQNVKAHRGTIHLESQLGKGSSFEIFLPIGTDTTGFLSGEIEERSHSSESRTLMVVDQDESVLGMMKKLLESLNYNVIISTSCESALASLTRFGDAIDLAILDNSVPGIEGKEALTNILQHDTGVNVLLTTSAMGSSPQSPLPGFRGVIHKPFRLKKLIDGINAALA